jgi:hypothetical protein
LNRTVSLINVLRSKVLKMYPYGSPDFTINENKTFPEI